jgi:hypothetical protein
MKRAYDYTSAAIPLAGVLLIVAMSTGCGRSGTGDPKGAGGATQGTGGTTGITGTGGASQGTGGKTGVPGLGGATGVGGSGTGGLMNGGTSGSASGGAAGNSGSGGTQAGAGGKTTSGTGGKATGGTGGAGGTGGTQTAISGTGGGGDASAGDTSAGGGDARDSAGPSSKYVGPCTSTEVMTSGGSVSVTSYVYDADQRLLREESGFDANGVPRYIVAYTYDEHGWLLESKSNDCDNPAWGCRWFIYTYDAAGRVLTLDDRSDYSGRAPGCTTNTYDQNGRLVRRAFDDFCQGSAGEATVYEYDSLGRLVSERFEVGGKPQTPTTYSYDAAGFLAFTYRGYETIVYTRDAAGNPLVEEHQQTSGVGDDYSVFRTFDSAGHQLSERTRYSEGVNAGVDLWCWRRTFDSCGNLLTEEQWSSNCDDPSYSRTTLGYQCFSTDPDRG